MWIHFLLLISIIFLRLFHKIKYRITIKPVVLSVFEYCRNALSAIIYPFAFTVAEGDRENGSENYIWKYLLSCTPLARERTCDDWKIVEASRCKSWCTSARSRWSRRSQIRRCLERRWTWSYTIRKSFVLRVNSETESLNNVQRRLKF